MESTYIRDTQNSRIRSATTFGGINRANGTPLGEWDRLNGFDLTAYPALRTCLPYAYSTVMTSSGVTGYTYRNGKLIYTTAEGIYLDGKDTLTKIPGLTAGDKTLVNIGAYIVILPDWALVNTADTENPVVMAKGTVLTGTLMEYNSNVTKPSVSIFKRFYVDAPTAEVTASGLSVGDSVKLSWKFGERKMSKQVTINNIGVEDYTASGMTSICFDTTEMSNTQWFYAENRAMEAFRIIHITGATIQRVMPDLDYVVEYNNRLWGCSSAKHEIYCSKLGEPLVWGAYSGISTDSWAATVGTDGDFTGACVYNGCILFFKEDCVHSVYGTKASNFTITTYTVRGVQKGSAKSLCISEGLLYYKAPEGIFTFNGSSSSRFDGKLCVDRNSRTACGTADDRYIVMAMQDGTVYYYDKLHSVWYTRTLPNVVSMHNFSGSLYAITKDSKNVMRKVMLTTDAGMDDRVTETAFEAISGELCRGELMSTSSYTRKAMHTMIRKLTMSLEEHHTADVTAVQFDVMVRYDGGEWQTVYSYDGKKEASDGNVVTLIPIIPMRCQRLRIRVKGKLTTSPTAVTQPYVTLYGLFIDTEEASEIGGKH